MQEFKKKSFLCLNLTIKLFLIYSIFLLKTFINSKMYEDYQSFDGCEPVSKCSFRTYPELYKGFVRGLGPICQDEDSMLRSYFDCADRFFECGYINLYNKTQINPNEGVHLINGLDLSKVSEEDLKDLKIEETLIQKVRPFLGLKGSEAVNKLDAEHLQLTSPEAEHLYKALTQNQMSKLKDKFSSLKGNFTDADDVFQQIPIEIKAALLSQFDIYAGIPDSYKDSILAQKWEDLADQIKKNPLPNTYITGNFYKNVLRKNLDAYLVDSVESKTQSANLRGVFLIDLTNSYKADLLKYQSYILAIKSVIKNLMDKEKCDNCTNSKIHEYSVIVYRDETLLLSNFSSTANDTFKNLDQIIIPDSYSEDTRPRNTWKALGSAIWMFMNQTMSFDKLKTIVLFTNGSPDDEFKDAKKYLQNNSINLAVVDMSLIKEDNVIPYIAEGPYNYIKYDLDNSETQRNQTDNKNLKCLSQQVLNLFSTQNIFLEKNHDYKNSSIDHNNTVFFQAVKPADKNLKISLLLNTFPEQNYLKMFVSYDYPFPDYHTSLYIHPGDNYLPLKTVVVGNDSDRPELNKLDRIVYITLIGSNDDFGLKVEECDPDKCSVGTNYNDNDYPFPKWIIVLLILLGSLFVLFGIWYVGKNYRKNAPRDDLEHGYSNYMNINK